MTQFDYARQAAADREGVSAEQLRAGIASGVNYEGLKGGGTYE